jgi:hypothetical protein
MKILGKSIATAAFFITVACVAIFADGEATIAVVPISIAGVVIMCFMWDAE